MSRPVIATLAVLAWGAFAFGAVYPWAFIPLFAGCTLVGAFGLLQRRTRAGADRSIRIALIVLLAAIAIQLVPLPVTVLRTLSPATDVILQRYEVGYFQSDQYHALTIRPRDTAAALAAACALGLLLLGLIRLLDRAQIFQLVYGITLLGVVLALIGIVQKALWNGKIYGVWAPFEEGLSFGPFVNRNHFAGWMMMAMPLALGCLIARVMQGMRHVKRDWRSRLVWFSSSEASETILMAFAVLVMALGLTMSMSRSGTLGLIAALAIAAWFVMRRRTTSVSRRGVLATYFVFVMVAAIGWAGVDRLAARFGSDDPMTLGNRTIIWNDTLQIARDFPLFGTGLNTYWVSMMSYQTVMPEKHLAQAHNDYLQLMAEGGILVGIPAAFAIVVIVRLIRERFRGVSRESTDYWIRVGAVTGIAAIALQEVADFSLQMPGNAVLFVVLLAIALRPVDNSSPAIDARRRA